MIWGTRAWRRRSSGAVGWFALSMQVAAKDECVRKSSANSLDRRHSWCLPMTWRMVSSLETALKLKGVAAVSAGGDFRRTGGGTLNMGVLVGMWVCVNGGW